MDAPQPPIIHAQCGCGKRIRIRNARPGTLISCPACGRSIVIAEADLLAAAAPEETVQLQTESFEAKEAIPVAGGVVRPAVKGSRPGVRSGTAYSHEDAMLSSAMSGRPLDVPAGETGVTMRMPSEEELLQQPFVQDLIASFYFAGDWRNAADLGVRVLFWSLGVAVLLLLPWSFGGLLLMALGGIVLFMFGYSWLVLRTTAFGANRIPNKIAEGGFWSDIAWPSIWMTGVMFVCLIPSMLVSSYAPPGPSKEALVTAARAAGWFVWPAVLLLAACTSIVETVVRLDRIPRVIYALGWRYPLAWATVVTTHFLVNALIERGAALVGGFSSRPLIELAVHVLFVSMIVAAISYALYVTFRTIGLLFRHNPEAFEFKW